MRRACWAVLLLVAALAACRTESKPYASVGPEAAALRAAFNADLGAVRLVVLVAPT